MAYAVLKLLKTLIVERLSVDDNAAKSFNILATSLDVTSIIILMT